jgi:hypothetical protein
VQEASSACTSMPREHCTWGTAALPLTSKTMLPDHAKVLRCYDKAYTPCRSPLRSTCSTGTLHCPPPKRQSVLRLSVYATSPAPQPHTAVYKHRTHVLYHWVQVLSEAVTTGQPPWASYTLPRMHGDPHMPVNTLLHMYTGTYLNAPVSLQHRCQPHDCTHM